MAKVNDSLYAYRYEVTNREYNFFLNYLAKKDSVLYSRCTGDSEKWNQVFSYCAPMVSLSHSYHRHPAFADYPVVNISYDGAIEYCKWLTEIYNSYPKRKFRKTIFLLPDTTQWMLAARAGSKEKIRYPWDINSLRNKQGMYMCNMKRIFEERVVSDSLGWPVLIEEGYHPESFYTAAVKSFYPNAAGIYNMSGNVAEMTIEKGITKGGCWNSYGGEVTIASIKRYDEPSPEAGFRVFMKVLE